MDLGGKVAATTEQCCPGCRSIDGLYFAIPVLDRAYRMLDSTVGGWLFKFRVRFCQERRGFGKQAGNLLGWQSDCSARVKCLRYIKEK